MSADQWQLSLRQLYGTADLLEAGLVADPALALPAPVAASVVDAAPVVAPTRSTARMLAATAVHCALTVGALLGGFALADPVLPHPERPHLADPGGAMDELSGAARAIPQSGANQP